MSDLPTHESLDDNIDSILPTNIAAYPILSLLYHRDPDAILTTTAGLHQSVLAVNGMVKTP
ncbi:hypothetical protein [Flavihumibacter solisilvae]|uniref:hypothetical protein n=1 Tax=Flavihumibacter solisilvae TaxID=1349421 RepID=UPI000AD484FA|nr:hypothetical protein [Flavihumibacter solisilvae]